MASLAEACRKSEGMEFGFTAKQEELRKEVEAFYLEELPQDYNSDRSTITEGQQAFWRALQKRAAERRYLTPGWPEEYGGMGLDNIDQGVVHEVEGALGINWPAGAGLRLAGPATILFGTEEQKARVIPPIARGEAIWFQAFTEPEAGSDEANVQLRAVEDGDDFILNGQKTFISGIYEPDYLYTLARTADVAPKHRGISLFLIPADTPGITYRPQMTMGGGGQNDIFFDDVRVSRGSLLGELNKGFYHAMATFEFERSGTNWLGSSKRALQEFVQFCREETRNGKPLIDDPEVSRALAQMAVDLQVQELVTWHTIWWFTQRERLGPKPFDLSAFFLKKFNTKHNEIMMRTLGTYGQLKKGSRWAKMFGRIESQWQRMRTWHAGGTVEIYKVILASRGLGLPRAARPKTRTE
jgi:alkylation response protein AidB-like acyl-CoA dehydrogenase